mmetsp:Transcript_26266/g.38483  ORF Transcript_26266/g.38483 Transcript_26266/m.38483 type:complete len:120 (+) Transcript_26266:419-778(+)
MGNGSDSNLVQRLVQCLAPQKDQKTDPSLVSATGPMMDFDLVHCSEESWDALMVPVMVHGMATYWVGSTNWETPMVLLMGRSIVTEQSLQSPLVQDSDLLKDPYSVRSTEESMEFDLVP